MRLFRGKILGLVDELIQTLAQSGDVEFESTEEAKLDLEAVLKEFLRLERTIVDEAKTRMEREGLGYSHLGKTKRRVMKEKKFPDQDEQLPYLVQQLMDMLFHSNHVAEIYLDDNGLRKLIAPIMKKHMKADDGLDEEVRAKIKNLEEGTASFEIEYSRLLDQIKRNKGMS